MTEIKTALVTGGAGFIGSHLARRLISENWRVDIIDNLSTGFEENIPREAEFFCLDLSHDDMIKKIPEKKYDAIFHLAAQSSGEISFDDPLYDIKTNCVSTLMLLDLCKKRGINRFIYTSSMSIYGDQMVQPVKENILPLPKSFYGVGKLASESYMSIYQQMGVNTTAFRLFNVYGPGQNLKNLRQGMVSIYMAYLLKNEEIIVKGSLDRYRDLIFVGDVVEAIMCSIGNPNTYGKAYNVGTGVKTTVEDLLFAEIQAFNLSRDYPIRICDGTPGDTFGICADITEITEDTAWRPTVSLHEGLKIMVQWAKESMSQ